MTIFTEFIAGDVVGFEVYGGLTACTHYLLPSIGDGAVAFRALSVDDQVRMLVSATRFVEEQYWQGVATGLAGGTPTTLAFPRTGLTDVNGAALDATNVPPQVVSAAFEMAAILAADPDALTATDSGSNVAELGAGPARIRFFRPSSPQDGNATVLPTVIDRLIGRWLAAASAAAAFTGIATGVNASSNFWRGRCSSCGSASSCCCAEQRPDRGWPL